MKNLVIITLLFLPFLGSAQITKKSIDSFLGIKFGSSRAEVRTALTKNGVDYLTTSKDSLNVVGGVVKHYDKQASIATISFVNDKAYRASFIFTEPDENKVFALYQDLIKSITNIYGKGNVGIQNDSGQDVKYPTKGEEIKMIKMGIHKYTAGWLNNNRNSVFILINPDLSIVVMYTDEALSDLVK